MRASVDISAKTSQTRTRPAAGLTGPLLMLASAGLFAALTIIIKTCDAAFTIWHIAFYRYFGGLLALWLITRQIGGPFRTRQPGLMLLRGAVGTCAFLSIVAAIRMIPLSTAMILFYSFPAFTALLAPLIFGEKMRLAEAVSVGAALLGVMVLFDFQFQGNAGGKLLALGGGAIAGFTVALIKHLRKTNGAIPLYAYFCLVGGLVSLPSFVQSPMWPATPGQWLAVIGIIVTSTSAQIIMNQGFAHCKSWEGGLIMTSELLMTAAFGILVLDEPLTWNLAAGGGLILFSAAAVHLFGRLGHTAPKVSWPGPRPGA